MSLTTRLTALEASGLLRLAQSEPELEYLFRHALVQDAAYESLLKAERRVLHRAVAETLEKLYPQQEAELASTLGYHYSAAGETEQARKYFMLAGDNALAQYANVEAEQHYRAALNWVTSEPDKARALFGLGEAVLGQSRFDGAIQIWRDAIPAYQSLQDDNLVARLYARMSRAAWEDGDTPRGLALSREGLGAVAEGLETQGMAALFHEAARACYFNGLPDEGQSLCQQALEIAEQVGDVETQAETLITLAGLLEATRQYDEEMSVLTRAVALAESAELLSTAVRAYNNLGGFLVGIIGDFHAGRDYLLRTVELNQRRGAVDSEVFSLAMVSWPLLLLGDFAEADETHLKARHLLTTLVNPDSYALLLLRVVQAGLLEYRGEWQAATQSLRASRVEARQRGNLEMLVDIDLYLAETLLELGEWEEAGNAAEEALTINERGVAVNLSTLSRRLLATVRGREGRLKEARQLLAEARKQVGRHPTAIEEEDLSLTEARLAAIEGHWPEALAAFKATAQAQEHMGKRWYRAQTLREWAEAHLSRNEPGDVGRARDLLREALSEFEAMSVPIYAARAQDRLRALDERN